MLVSLLASVSGSVPWTTMDTIFLVTGIAGGIAFLVWLVLQFMGGLGGDAAMSGAGADGALDVSSGLGGEADLSFTLLSFHGLSSFLTMFGFVGLSAHREAGFSTWLAVLTGIAAGFATTWIIGRLFTMFRRFQSSGSLKMENTVGAVGVVYLNIPATGTGTGKVQVQVQGRLMEFDAVSEVSNTIETGRQIRVLRVASGNTLVVAPI